MKKGILTLLVILLLIAALIVGGVLLFRSLASNGGEEAAPPSGPVGGGSPQPAPTPIPIPTPPPHVHEFSAEYPEAQYLAAEATCLSPATYYYVCGCGEVGTTTYTYGALGAHAIEDGVCTRCHRGESIGLVFTPNTYDHSDPNALRTCTLSGLGTCTDSDLVIPALSPDGMRVTRIATSAFEGNTTLERVTFPAYLYEIDLDAFKNASALHTLLFAKEGKLQTIRTGAFMGCNALQSITLPEGLRSLGAEAFMHCQYLTEVTLPSTLTSVPQHAFAECKLLAEITLPEGLEAIDESAFAFCPCLVNVTLPQTLQTVGADSFAHTGFTEVHLPVNLESIHHDAFSGCYDLAVITVDEGNATYKAVDGILYRKSNNEMVIFPPAKRVTNLVIPEGTTTIYADSFSEVQGIANITLPASVTRIENGAFFYSTLESITIPANSQLTEIGEAAFIGCHNLKRFDVPAGVTKIGYNTFANCESLAEVTLPYGITTIDAYAFAGCTSLTRITIPESVTKIEGAAFQWSGLTSITIPRSVTEIGDSAFWICRDLAAITVATDNLCYKSMDGVLYTKDGKTLITYPAGKADKNFAVPTGVEHVRAFSYCAALESIYLPPSVLTFEDFEHCESLKRITFDENCNTYCIGDNTFEGCKSLTEIVLPNGMRTIAYNAFKNCESLMSVTLPVSITTIEAFVFEGCTALTDIYFDGTAAAWSAVGRSEYWDANMSTSYTLHCTDSDTTAQSPDVPH